ncbi:MAG: PAS domain S-box protein [Desulfobacteraceae bacterium]|nr:MAG: PAS domain S-box protein [Desulfobacteraceae bacterium]
MVERIHPEDLSRVEAQQRRCMAERLPFEDEYRVAWPDGIVRWVADRGVFQYGANGDCNRMLGILMDITERKRAEDALRESQKLLVADLDAMTKLQKLGTLFASEGNLGLVLGEIVETAIAISGADFGNIQLLDAESSQLRIVAHRGFPEWWIDFWNRGFECKGSCTVALGRGERIIVEDVEQSPIFAGTPGLEIQLKAGVRAVQSTPLVSRSGEPLGMFSTHYRTPHRPDERTLRLLDLLARHAADIIERLQHEEALRRSRDELELRVQERTAELKRKTQLLNAISRNAPDLIFAKDRESRLVYASESTLRVLGKSAQQTLGKTDTEFHADPALGLAVMENDRIVRETRLPLVVEEPTRLPDGTLRVFHSTKVPWLGEDGTLLGTFGISVDITKRKEEEAALEALNEKLEHKNRELQEFAFVASHDLNEPLRKIQTFGDLLKSRSADRLGEQERDYLARMTGAASRIQELLDALLRYSRVETQAQDFVPVKLEDVAKAVVTDLEVAIKKAGANVEIGPLPMISGDPYQWRQVFQNLIGNAAKYYRSEVKPFIRIYGEENHGDSSIFVEDNGIGFDEKYLGQIFEPFKRLHGKNEYPGTGIGLAICKKIVERHGGTITARSTPGKGSTFMIALQTRKEEK